MAQALQTLTERPSGYLRLIDAAREWPGGPIHPASITRHILKGVKLRNGSRRRLWALKTPGGWVTSREAIDEFLAVLTADRLGEAPRPAVEPAAVAAALDAAGF
jgi:hypothetical protein